MWKLQRKQKQQRRRVLRKEQELEKIQKRWNLKIENEIKTRGLKHEPFKFGRYSDFYSHASHKLPWFFMSMEEEKIRGSAPGGFLSGWVEKHNINQKTIDKTVPQIRLVPKEQIAAHLLEALEKINTADKRAAIDKMNENAPFLKKTVVSMARQWIAAIDWAEQTYKIQINLDTGLLAWIGKAN